MLEFNESPKTFYFLSKNGEIRHHAHYATKLIIEIWRAALQIFELRFTYIYIYDLATMHSRIHGRRGPQHATNEGLNMYKISLEYFKRIGALVFEKSGPPFEVFNKNKTLITFFSKRSSSFNFAPIVLKFWGNIFKMFDLNI